MIDVAVLPAAQRRSPSPPTARRTVRALTSLRPKIHFERRPDAKPAHALDQKGWSSSVPSTRLRVTARRSDARNLPAIYKSP
jgi:uncharacterized membrane protein